MTDDLENSNITVTGEIDAGWSSYWPPDENGEGVAKPDAASADGEVQTVIDDRGDGNGTPEQSDGGDDDE